MKLLLTGADGFTGIHFSRCAQEAGHEVIALRSNLNDRAALRHEVLQVEPELVVHLAAISFVGHADASAFYEVNVLGTMNLLDALCALPTPPHNILLASSANIYGNCDQSPITEDQPPAPVNHYAMSKLAMEYMARTYIDRLRLFFVRPFNYTGLGQADFFVIPKIVKHFARREASIELGNIAVEREFNDVRFVCEVYLRLLEKAISGEIYNICSGRPITLEAVINLMGVITAHMIEVKRNPAFVRANEVHSLCGSNAKLVGTVGNIESLSFQETLTWMLKSSAVDA